MRKLISITLIVSGFLCLSFSKKDNVISISNIGNEIAMYIKRGDASSITKWFGSSVELSILGKKGNYSKTQAEIVLKDFFAQYPPESFTITSEGNSAAYSLYSIGSYESKGKNFKTYYLIRKIDEEYKLHILKFEEIK